MKGFLLGLVVAGLAFGGYYYWKQFMHPPAKPVAVADAGAPAKEAREKKKKRRRGAVRVARNEAPGQAPSPGRPPRSRLRWRPSPSRSSCRRPT